MITSLPTKRISAKNIDQSFTHKMAAKASWHRNYVTVILCIRNTAVIGTRRPQAVLDAGYFKYVLMFRGLCPVLVTTIIGITYKTSVTRHH